MKPPSFDDVTVPQTDEEIDQLALKPAYKKKW